MPALLPAPDVDFIDFIDNFARWQQASCALDTRLQSQTAASSTEASAAASSTMSTEVLPGLEVQDSDWSDWEAWAAWDAASRGMPGA